MMEVKISMSPDDFRDVSAVEEMTGSNFSEIYRHFFAPRMRALAETLREVQGAGLELDRRSFDDVWLVQMTSDELASIYSAESTLQSGR